MAQEQFPTEAGIAATEAAVAAYVKGLNKKQVAALKELMKFGRDNAGWKQFGRAVLAA